MGYKIMIRKSFLLNLLIVTLAFHLLLPNLLTALPFNDDMVVNPMKTGSVMRQRPKGSLALGASSFIVESRDEALKLTNPIKDDALSVKNGTRLFRINCFPCHGDISSNPWVPGPVAKFVPGPNLAVETYWEKPSDPSKGPGRSDGAIFGAIHFGSPSTVMPAVGWKLSVSEHWDLVNYVRSVQKKSQTDKK